ncbi:MAG TPA: SAM-dependent methyltransferase [Thermoleophilaceae bacterium]|nr:SAM-dependent methyltransferase [Thermoleophilaceae bacterium]
MTAPADPFAGAGLTALGLAAARSVETGRPDRLIEDPFARALYDAAGRDLGMRLEWPDDPGSVTDTEALHLHGSRYIGLRTRFYDDVLLRAAEAGAGQAVLLGAGLDTRSRRLGLPGSLTLFEVDRPAVLAFKEEALAGAPATCRLVGVGADLGEGWHEALDAAGLDPGVPTVWMAEGLMPYLDEAAQLALLDAVARRAPEGSGVAFDQVAGGDVEALSRRSGIDMEGLLAGTGGTGGLAGALRGRGWSVEVEGADAVAARYGRDLSDPFGGPGGDPPWLRTDFVRATRPAP